MKFIISKIFIFIITFSFLSFSAGSSLEMHSCENPSGISEKHCKDKPCCAKKTKSCHTKPTCCQSVNFSISLKENKTEIQHITSVEKIKIASPIPFPIFISTSKKEIIFYQYLPPLLVLDIPILSQQFRC
ncbi:MAG: hypothetical protein Q3983_07155 [Capnocytophaga sp.]|nr:hypothetical protein [Capnocytophaga sp.]